MSMYARAVAVLLLVAALVAGWWRLTAHHERIGYDRRKAEDEAAMELQREANRGRLRTAETQYAAQAEVRERFIAVTVKEIQHATASLAACPVPDPVVRLLNDAAECAGKDRPATCGADKPVPPS